MATSLEVVELVRETAMLKQMRQLTEQEELALVTRLLRLNESIADLRKRAEWVLKTDTFGTIALQYWLAGAPPNRWICQNCGKETNLLIQSRLCEACT